MNKKKEEFIICKFSENTDCFARVEEKFCNALNNCNFRTGDCPFYKSKEKNENQLKKIAERLKKEGLSK